MRRTQAALAACIIIISFISGESGRNSLNAQGMTSAPMPDAKQMSGIPLPVSDLPPGTVTVRVVRGSMANAIVDQPVELSGGPSVLTARTNESGRAEFRGLQPGVRVRAAATVSGERLESHEFPVPAAGGIRLALVATAASTENRGEDARAPATTGPEAGHIALGERSRFVFEMGDDALNVFNILEIVNAGSAPVRPGDPIVFELPEAAQGAGVLQGSSPQATIAGRRVTVTGPFAPGATVVQFGYSLPIDGGTLAFEQKLPIELAQLSLMVQKIGDMQVQSAQIAEHREMPLQDQTFIVAKGPGVKAGDTLALRLSGLPHQPTWPRNVALGLALLIFAGGVWGTWRSDKPAPAENRRRRLEATRDRLFAELESLEEQHREHSIDPDRYVTRRRELVSSLERLYAEMDDEAVA